MKKYILTVLSVFLTLSLGAQNMYDAFTFGAIDYLGSARVVGLGGAVTAVGSDLGTIGINPAGSSVANYSQFTISPSLSISRTNAAFQLEPTTGILRPYSKSTTKLALPNIGYITKFDIGADVSVSLGLAVNTVYDYNYSHSGQGENSYSSKFAEMARAADGMTEKELAGKDFYDDSNHALLWDVAMGYDAGLINAYGSENKYVGCTEVLTSDGRRYVPGVLRQRSQKNISGSKDDVILNLALDFSRKFFLGFNVGLPVMSYSSSERFIETAKVVEDFPIKFVTSGGVEENTYFSNAVYQYNYDASGQGVYAKVGFIYLPFKGLRIGAAYQTPTIMDISETWVHSGRVSYANGRSYNAASPEGKYDYTLVTPHHFDFGIAYTFGKVGLVSVDYSLEDYSSVRFVDSYDDFAFEQTNDKISKFSGMAHSLRAGAEINLLKSFALRGGANMVTSAEKYYTNGANDTFYNNYNEGDVLPTDSKYVKDIRFSYSLGFSYNPTGSFFADFAVRWAHYPKSIYQPYYDYDDVYSPTFHIQSSLVNAVMTLGWRF